MKTSISCFLPSSSGLVPRYSSKAPAAPFVPAVEMTLNTAGCAPTAIPVRAAIAFAWLGPRAVFATAVGTGRTVSEGDLYRVRSSLSLLSVLLTLCPPHELARSLQPGRQDSAQALRQVPGRFDIGRPRAAPCLPPLGGNPD